LSKYLSKAFRSLDFSSIYDVHSVLNSIESDSFCPLALYWALNVRFFGCSRNLEVVRLSVGVRGVSEWVFLGSGYVVNPDVLPVVVDKPPWEFALPNCLPPTYLLV